MRVIGGACKGRRLKAGRGTALRPTSDKVRQAIFNIIPAGLEDYNVLDLFAGTGALGIEALSRGASKALFADHHRSAVNIIRENADSCGLADQAKIMHLKLPGALKRIAGIAGPGEQYNLVFIDPPYGKELVDKTIAELAKLELVAPGGIIVAEHSARDELKVTEFIETHRKVYSTTAVTFFERPFNNGKNQG